MDKKIPVETLKEEANALERLILDSVDLDDREFYSIITPPLVSFKVGRKNPNVKPHLDSFDGPYQERWTNGTP